MKERVAKAVEDLPSAVQRLAKYADILLPGEVEPPILTPPVRAALFDWMAEIRAAEQLAGVGLKPRRLALLYGPPGCGKTTFAHHFAARLGLPLACIRSESVISKYVGATGENLGDLFTALKIAAGEVVAFFDEIDAIGLKREHSQASSNERSSYLNVFLRRIEMLSGISLAATNREDALDPALWRRFDLQIKVELPGPDERFAILKRYGLPFAFAEDDLELIVEHTGGASPALLRGLMEGMKRALVMLPALNRPCSDPVEILRSVIASVAPPPGYDPVPPLWREHNLRDFASMTWPPAREDATAA